MLQSGGILITFLNQMGVNPIIFGAEAGSCVINVFACNIGSDGSDLENNLILILNVPVHLPRSLKSSIPTIYGHAISDCEAGTLWVRLP